MKKKTAKRWSVLVLFLLPALCLSDGTPDTTKVKVITELANIREKPDIGSAIICQLPLNAVLEADRKEGEWYGVTFQPEQGEPISGYVHESLVLVLEEEPVRVVREKIKPAEKPPEKKEPPPEKSPPPPIEKPPEIRETEETKLTHAVVSSTVKKTRFSLWDIYLGGGLGYTEAGSLNKGGKGLADYLTAVTIGGKEGDISPLHWLLLFEAEIRYSWTPGMKIGLGVSYLSGSRESLYEIPGALPPANFENRPEIRMIPLSLTFTAYPFSAVYAKAGIEFLLAKCNYSYLIQEGETWEKWEGTASGQNLGVSGALGWEWAFHSRFSLFFELAGRYSRVSSLSGKNTYTDSEGLKAVEEGKLYLYQTKTGDGKAYDLMFVRNQKPSEAGVYNAAEAVLNLSGISLKTGLKISF